MTSLENANPRVYLVDDDLVEDPAEDENDNLRDEFTAQEVFELIRNLNDPGNYIYYRPSV